MVVGQQNKYKVGFIIQARMKSTRLPNKVLMPIPFGSDKPLLSWIIQELRESSYHGTIVIATSKNEENNKLEEYCVESGIICFRGAEDDVLSRFLEILEMENFDIVVRLTADNPILDSSILDKTISFHLEQQNDYTKTVGLPTGMNLEVFSKSSLLSLKYEKLSQQDKEHVTLFIRNSGRYKTGDYVPTIGNPLEKLRLTVDYPSDYLVVSSVLSKVASQETNSSKFSVIEEIYKSEPWIFEVNQANYQKQQPTSIEEEVRIASELLDKFDLKDAAKILNGNYTL